MQEARFERMIICETIESRRGLVSRLRREGKPMQASAKSPLTVRMVRGIIQETMPGPLPKPPGRPPGEPIIIKNPSRPPEAPEIDGSRDEEENEDPEIKRPPGIIPEMPPPPRPEEEAASALTHSVDSPVVMGVADCAHGSGCLPPRLR
jgi:hypothetical protein